MSFDKAFKVWLSTLNEAQQKRAVPNDQRRKKYEDRRREGYSQEQIEEALRGWKYDPWEGRQDFHCHDMAVLLRDGGQVEKFSILFEENRPRTKSDLPDGYVHVDGRRWNKSLEAFQSKDEWDKSHGGVH